MSFVRRVFEIIYSLAMCMYEVQMAEVFASQCLRLGRAAAEGSAIRKSTCFQRVQERIVLNSSGMCSMDWPVVCSGH